MHEYTWFFFFYQEHIIHHLHCISLPCMIPGKHIEVLTKLIIQLLRQPRIDEKHPKWLHLRVRPSTLPVLDSKHNPSSRSKTKILVDGRWTLAFKDDQACKSAESMVIREMHQLQDRVKETLKPLVDDHATSYSSNPSHKSSDTLLEEQPLNTGW